MLSKLVFTLFSVVAMFISSAQAINLARSGETLFVHGTVVSGDELKLKQKLVPEIKYVILRSLGGNSWEDARAMANVIEAAEITTVLHGPCTSLACAMMFVSGKHRMFSAVGRAEMSYLRIVGTYPSNGSEVPYGPADQFWRFATEIPAALRNKYLENHKSKSSSMLFFHPKAVTSKGTALGCATRASLPDCVPLENIDALSAKIITTEERYAGRGELKEIADMVPPGGSNFAQLTDVPPGMIMTDECKESYQRFLQQDKPRAFVISNRAGCRSYNAQSLRPYTFAMDDCKKTGAECKFYAVDDRIVFTPFE